MPTIQCHIGSRVYRLDYERTDLTSGSLYKGTLYTDRILDFFFEISEEGDERLFGPSGTAEEVKGPVMRAILGREIREI